VAIYAGDAGMRGGQICRVFGGMMRSSPQILANWYIPNHTHWQLSTNRVSAPRRTCKCAPFIRIRRWKKKFFTEDRNRLNIPTPEFLYDLKDDHD
jgi:hypothetical protein